MLAPHAAAGWAGGAAPRQPQPHFLRLEQLHRKPAPATELATRRVERAGGSIRGAGRLRAASAALSHGQRDRGGRIAAQARERLRRRELLRPFKGQPVAVPQCALDRKD